MGTKMLQIHELKAGQLFYFHNRAVNGSVLCYVEPVDRPGWGGVPWQIYGLAPTGTVYARPDILVRVHDERA